MIPIISQQKLCDSGRPHPFHTIPHPESYHSESERLTGRKIPALQGKQESRERSSSSSSTHTPGPGCVLCGGGVPPPSRDRNSGPGLSEHWRLIRSRVHEDVQAVPGSASSDQRGEGQMILASHRHPAPHLANGDPHGAIDERMDR
jgi:hypothetical protein